MLNFPSTTFVGKTMPKDAFYRRLKLSTEVREKFVSDVKCIVLEYKLAPETLNVETGGTITEILVLSIDLKKQEFDYRIVENIVRQNPHNLIFVLRFQGQGQLAVYCGKLYKTDWFPIEEIALELRGLRLEAIWEGFIEQIAVQKDAIPDSCNLSVVDKLKKQDTVLKLQKEIERLERLSRSEIQPKKKFELFTRLQELKKNLAEEKGE